jgi:hypothetical protein
MADLTTDDAVTGSQVAITHVDDSGTDPVRTVLALAAKDDLTVTIEDEEEDFNPAARYATRRYIVSGTIDIEVSSAVATDLSQLELLSISDSNDQLNRQPGDRRIGADGNAYVEFAFFDGEPDFGSVDLVADSEILMRFGDVQIANPEVDASASPIMVSFQGWVSGEMYFDYVP